VIGDRIILIVRVKYRGELKIPDSSTIKAFHWFVRDSDAIGLLHREGTFLALIAPEESKRI
jgi:hypothetical protein